MNKKPVENKKESHKKKNNSYFSNKTSHAEKNHSKQIMNSDEEFDVIRSTN